MPNQLEIVETQALNLTAEERAQLADRLITSLIEDHDIEHAWAAEVERRIEEIENGRAKLIPAAESIARARAATSLTDAQRAELDCRLVDHEVNPNDVVAWEDVKSSITTRLKR